MLGLLSTEVTETSAPPTCDATSPYWFSAATTAIVPGRTWPPVDPHPLMSTTAPRPRAAVRAASGTRLTAGDLMRPQST